MWLVISAPQSLVNKFTVLTIEDPNTIDSELVDVRVTGHKALGESSVNITVSSYDTTHLQENPQRLG